VSYLIDPSDPDTDIVTFSFEKDKFAVMMKLATEQNYKFIPHKDGTWSATNQDSPNMRGTVGPHTLEHLLVVLVG
jgi:hypothetical protein